MNEVKLRCKIGTYFSNEGLELWPATQGSKTQKKVGRVGLLSFYLDVIYIQKVQEFILCAHVTLPTYFAYKCGWNTSYVDLSSYKKNGWIVWNIINSCKNICKKFGSTMEFHNWYNSL